MKAFWTPYTLNFNFDARTSRGAMSVKDTYFIKVEDNSGTTLGYAECPLFKGLSAEDSPLFEDKLAMACKNPEEATNSDCSSIRFAFESIALRGSRDWCAGAKSIEINGLIWMADKQTMARQIAHKLEAGFKVLKLKIGGIDFEQELDLIKSIRNTFSSKDLEIRLDANGSFTPQNALTRLEELSRFDIHSLEQPIRAGQWTEMRQVIERSPIAIALDEELIGVRSMEQKKDLLDALSPHYIILKPSLCGGFRDADEYIALTEERGIGWWATSALESNIGLSAIAAWLSHRDISMPQGLGTGQLYTNNFACPLQLDGSKLTYNPALEFQSLESLSWKQ